MVMDTSSLNALRWNANGRPSSRRWDAIRVPPKNTSAAQQKLCFLQLLHVLPVSSVAPAQHDFRIHSTVSTVAAFAPEWISASAPEIRTVTATLPQCEV